MTTVNVKRRHVNRDYFDRRTQGYFSDTKQLSGEKHWETDQLTNLTSHDITYTFKKPFIVNPIGYSTVKAYRMEQHPDEPSCLILSNVLLSFPINVTPLNTLVLRIEPTESLTGVIVEFQLTE